MRIGDRCWHAAECDQPVLAVKGGRVPTALGGRVRSIWIDGGGRSPYRSAKAGSSVQMDSGANSQPYVDIGLPVCGRRRDGADGQPPAAEAVSKLTAIMTAARSWAA